MTTQEFSDSFDTLLNSYSHEAIFGEGASKQDISLDEYEKSVFLTQAQDIVVKSYFDANMNNERHGFDDSTRRQIDFSALLTVSECTALTDDEISDGVGDTFNDRGVLYYMPTNVLYILNEKIKGTTSIISSNKVITDGSGTLVVLLSSSYLTITTSTSSSVNDNGNAVTTTVETITTASSLAEATSDNTFIITTTTEYTTKNYVVVPISYTEYDRVNSKPFKQALKNQCWRLFQNNTTDLVAELIPNSDITIVSYKVRYVRRPTPIVLVNLEDDNLEIDGVTAVTECELNSILHNEILLKAVELALTTRGGRMPTTQAQQAQQAQ